MDERPGTRQVLLRERLCPGTVRLRLERRGLDFRPGQYLSLGLPGSQRSREYSIHSGLQDPWLDFLIREVGQTSRDLAGTAGASAAAEAGWLEAEGPFGFLGPDGDELDTGRPVLLIASGVGIAPFHSMVQSWPKLDYLLLHGVRCPAELYDRADFSPSRHLPCISGSDHGGFFAGRVTDFLNTSAAALAGRWGARWADEALCLLAGSSDMVHDAWDLLAGAGVSPDRIRTEIFF